MESEFLEVPVHLKGYVIGKGGRTINEIRQNSGARVDSLSKEEGGFTITGDEEQRTCAKRLIIEKVVSFDEMSSKGVFLSIKFVLVGTFNFSGWQNRFCLGMMHCRQNKL